MYPEVELPKGNVIEIKDQLVSIMTDNDFNIIESGDYKLDFRKDYQPGQAAIGRALLQAIDGSNIDSYGVEYTLMPKKDKIIVKGRPYYYKTFRFNQQQPKKEDLLNNQEAVDKVQVYLDSLERFFINQKVDTQMPKVVQAAVKVEPTIFVSNEKKCDELKKTYMYNSETQAWGCIVTQKDFQ